MNEMNVRKNPCEMSAPDPNKVSAFALDGKAIKLSPITAGDKTIINLSELTHGIYIIKINNKSIKVARQ